MNKTLNAVIFSDIAHPDLLTRNFGAHVISNQIINYGYTSCVVDFASSLNWNTFTEIVDKLIGKDTIIVGFSVTWFPSKQTKTRFLDSADEQGGLIGSDTTSIFKQSLSYNFSIGESKRYIDYIKSKNPNIRIIVGGAKAYEYIDDNCIDNILIGFSENQIIDVLDALKNNTTINRIINHDVKAQTGSYSFNESMVKYYPSDGIHKDDVLMIEFARGCIFNCTFCSWPMRGQDTRPYQKYKEVLKKELADNFHHWGVTKYAITDDTFNDHIDKLRLIKEVTEELPFKLKFWCYARLDLIAAHPEMAQLMLDIGVVEVFFGIETWHDETAKIIRKGNRARKIRGIEIARAVWGNQVNISAALVVGLPEDTKESFNEFKKWHDDIGKYLIDYVSANPLYLRSPDANSQYMFLSDIEQNLKKYNYVLDSNRDGSWKRSDGGDISTRNIAEDVTNELNNAQPAIARKGLDYTSHIHKIIKDPSLTTAEAVSKYANDVYFPNLIQSFDKY